MQENFYDILPYIVLVLVIISFIENRNRIIEKEKAYTFFKQTKKFFVLFAVIQSSILLYLHFFVYPTLNNAFSESNSTSFLLKISPYSTFVIIPIVIAVTLFAYFSKSIAQEFEENLKKHKDDVKIKISDLTTGKLKLLINLVMYLPLFVIVLFVLIPGFQLISVASNWRLK
ncbi:MAG: hypothetical protein G01um101430_57 [Parcubacteria group bacterium Gr01-1014_30]|nr:MAG: hypothetical protein G01um101430_57 [Parcubacteria group bacterium Gr01-1014_30]